MLMLSSRIYIRMQRNSYETIFCCAILAPLRCHCSLPQPLKPASMLTSPSSVPLCVCLYLCLDVCLSPRMFVTGHRPERVRQTNWIYVRRRSSVAIPLTHGAQAAPPSVRRRRAVRKDCVSKPADTRMSHYTAST